MGSEASLKSLCELVVDCPHSTPVWTADGAIVLRSRNIRNGRLDLAEPSYTDLDHFRSRIKRARPRAGDIVITREAPMGECAMIPGGLECCLGQRMVLLRPDPDRVVPRYLLYALQSPAVRWEIGAHEGTGSTVSNLRIPALEALKIATPPLEEQRRVAAILGALDYKIELNRRMSRTLDDIARAVFRSLVASVEWPEGSLYDLCDVVYGAPFKSSRFNSEGTGVGVIRIRDIASDSASAFTDEQHPRSNIIRGGDIVVGMDGEFLVKHWMGDDALLNQRVCHLAPKPSVPRSLLALLAGPAIRFFETAKTGTTVVHLGKADLDTIRIPIPDAAMLRRFGQLVEPTLDRRVATARESALLGHLRNALLPQLL